MAPRSTGRRKTPQRPGAAQESFTDRELSWLDFDARVLHEGLDPENPLLERLAFLAIAGSNLDEFFMVRVGRLEEEARRGGAAGAAAARKLAAIGERARDLVERLYRCLGQEVMPQLARRGIQRLRPEALDRKAEAVVARYFEDELFPSLTPLAVRGRERAPEIAGLTLHLAVRLRREGARGAREEEERLAFLPIPRGWPRFFTLPPDDGGRRFLLVEDVVRHRLERFFPGYQILESGLFRLTRSARVGLQDEEEVDDLLEAMEGVLRERSAGAPVRLEVEAAASSRLTGILAETLGLEPKGRGAVYAVNGPLDLRPFIRLAAELDGAGLRYRPFDPQPVPAVEAAESLWEAVRERDVLVHLPYESFRPVVDLVEAAAGDPQVLAIKQTLYRTSPGSPIIAALERAARAGKQVTVLVELKARFDEAQNIAWARRLSEAGAQVIWGVMGLKTHAKLLLVVRREADGTRRYVHLSTGNYNEVTATRYEDVGLFTCDPDFGADAANFFNAVTGYSEPYEWRALVVAPTRLRERLCELIDREVGRSSREAPGLIMLKMNALTDRPMAQKLLEAAEAGVRVRLCVRGSCCLRLPARRAAAGLEVVSVVDRFLEHSRIYYFRNGGDEEVWCASADLMPRNLDRRLEIMYPVRDEAARARLVGVLQTLFADNQRAWRLRPDGGWERASPRRGQAPVRAQQLFMEEAIARAQASRLHRLTVFRPQGPGARG